MSRVTKLDPDGPEILIQDDADVAAAVETSTDPMARLAAAMEAIAAKAGGGLTAEQFDTAMEKQRRTINPSNPFAPGISAFSHPEGDRARPKSPFHREVWFNGHREELDQVTPAEIAEYNALSQKIVPGGRRTSRDGTWIAEVSPNGDALRIFIPCKTVDQLGGLPNGLVLMLRELSEGAGSVDPAAMMAEIDRLRTIVEAHA